MISGKILTKFIKFINSYKLLDDPEQSNHWEKIINPLIPDGNRKVTHTQTNLQPILGIVIVRTPHPTPPPYFFFKGGDELSQN